MKTIRWFGWMLVMLGVTAFAASKAPQVTLVENGESRCVIAIDEKASRPERFGAKEIATYLTKVTGCKATPILDRVNPKSWKGWQKLITITVAELPELKPDGFVLDVQKDRIAIMGQNPRGALYGCYEVLKRSCGIRWLVPGEDGEYFTPAKTVGLEEGRFVCNPFIPIRQFSALPTDEEFEWAARNNAQGLIWFAHFNNPTCEGMQRRDRMEDLAVDGQGPGGHGLSDMLINRDWSDKRTAKQAAEELYAVHPEYFPMINGKRKLTWGAYDPNPCVSNSEVLDRMADYMIRELRKPHACDVNLIMGNNDTSVWCECDKCRAIDAPEAIGTRGARSDRFWYMVGGIAERVWKVLPNAKLGAWAYQDFWYPPKRVKIDPRLRVLISFNNQCWRHPVDDPNCPVNGEFRKIFGLWKATGLQVYNRDEISDEGSPGRYEPSEYVLYRNMLAYPDCGCAGDAFFVYSPFPAYMKWAAKLPPYYGRNYNWRAMWQTAWIAAQVQWNRDVDFAKLYEECNSLYYGKAWEGGMKEFRQYLTECFTNTPGCIGYGSGAPIGKCLDKPGSQEKLEALLDKAILAACAAGDERARRHVETDREIFALTWVKGRKDYLASYLESDAFARKGEIVIDGELNEKDWQDAKVLNDFEMHHETIPPSKAKAKTEARVAYDLDHLYFAVTCYEDAMDKIKAGKPDEVDRSGGWGALGDHVELFYQFPDMYEKAFHLSINSEGAIVDGLQKSASDRDITFETKAKWAVKKGADRWTLEIAIPASEIGSKLMTGMDWRVNVCRCRQSKGEPAENTSFCHGRFYGVSNFMHMKLK